MAFDLSNRLSLQMGILEGADVPDIFGDSIACMCSWKEDYYALDPSTGGLTAVSNLGGSPFSVHSPVTMAKWTVETDAVYGGNWFVNGGSPACCETLGLPEDARAYIDTHAPGIITLESYRASTDHRLAGNTPPYAWGVSLGRSAPSTGIIWRNLQRIDYPEPEYDYWSYKQITPVWSPASDGSYIHLGVPHGSIFNATHNPAKHASFSPGYLAGQNLVISWWFSANGFRMMINGHFVPVHSIRRHNADGSYVEDGYTKEQAEIAADHSIKAYSERMAVTYPTIVPGDGDLWCNFAMSNGQCDYQGIFSATKGDTWVKAAHALLLNAKP